MSESPGRHIDQRDQRFRLPSQSMRLMPPERLHSGSIACHLCRQVAAVAFAGVFWLCYIRLLLPLRDRLDLGIEVISSCADVFCFVGALVLNIVKTDNVKYTCVIRPGTGRAGIIVAFELSRKSTVLAWPNRGDSLVCVIVHIEMAAIQVASTSWDAWHHSDCLLWSDITTLSRFPHARAEPVNDVTGVSTAVIPLMLQLEMSALPQSCQGRLSSSKAQPNIPDGNPSYPRSHTALEQLFLRSRLTRDHSSRRAGW